MKKQFVVALALSMTTLGIGYLAAINSGTSALAKEQLRLSKQLEIPSVPVAQTQPVLTKTVDQASTETHPSEHKLPLEASASATTAKLEADSSSRLKVAPNYFSVRFGGNSLNIFPGGHRILLGDGSGGAAIRLAGEPVLLNAYVVKGKLVVDALLRGDIRIVANEFQKLPLDWDRNFNDSAFEVVDGGGTPMLQIIYDTPNVVTVNGLFYGKNLFCFASPKGMVVNPAKLSEVPGYPLKPLFKYPSRKY